jgi:RsiW-degrading membrane proteinase PrsW (M82 family)
VAGEAAAAATEAGRELIGAARKGATRFWDAAPSPRALLPLKAWWEGREWQRGTPLLFLAFGLAPWVILHAIGVNDSVTKAAWSFSDYFAVLWGVVMYMLIKPGRLRLVLMTKVAAVSAIIGIPLAIALEEHLASGSSLSVYIFGVGLPEEFAKALAVYVIMISFAKGRSYNVRTFMFMGAVSGLAFGAVEAVKYTPHYVDQLTQGQATGLLSTELIWRWLTDGLFHGCTAAVVGYFIGLSAHYPRWRVQLIGFALAVMAVVHGINDRYSEGWTQVLVAGLLLFIFIGYALTADTIE